MKHTFAAKNSARINAVKSADEFSRNIPNFDAVRVAGFVKFGVSFNKFSSYPSSALIVPINGGAIFDDAAKIFVNREIKIVFAPD
jgi:hypothetical protein